MTASDSDYEEEEKWLMDTPAARQVAAVFGDQARVTCVACPLQVEGWFRSKRFYFRARHGRWTLGLGDDDDAAVAASMSQFEPYPASSNIWSDTPHRYSSHGTPEPDDEEHAGTFGTWLLGRLEELEASSA